MLKLLILVMLLSGCCIRGNSNNICPDLVHYTEEDQEQLADILEKNYSSGDKKVVDRFIIDYHNLRNKIRECE